jgi:4-hydroxybenzoate polyprenyltransferase
MINFKKVPIVLKSFRFKDWIHYLGYTLLASILANNLNLLNFFLTTFLLSYSYSINEYYDRKMKKKYFVIPLLLSILMFLFVSPFSISISLLFLLIFTFYSWPKVWLEGRPILSTISNSIGFTLLFVLPFQSIGEVLRYRSLILLIFILNTVAQLIHEIVDFKEDKKINKITTAVKFGVRASIILIKSFLLIIILVSFLLLMEKFILVSLSSIIFSLYFLGKKRINNRIRNEFKLLGIFVGVVYFLDFIRLFV